MVASLPVIPFPVPDLLFPTRSVTWILPLVNWQVTRSTTEWLIGVAILSFILLMSVLILVRAIALLVTGRFSYAALFPMPGLGGDLLPKAVRSVLLVVVIPFVEEFIFRYLFFWYFCREVLGCGLMAAFWWPFVAFVLGHLLDVVVSFSEGDTTRILDPVNLGAFNAYAFAHVILIQGQDAWMAFLMCVILHAIYNGIVVVVLFFQRTWLLSWIRLAGLLWALAAYLVLFNLCLERQLWSW